MNRGPKSMSLRRRLAGVVTVSVAMLASGCGASSVAVDGIAAAADGDSSRTAEELAAGSPLPIADESDQGDAESGATFERAASGPAPLVLDIPGLVESMEPPSTLNATALVAEGSVAVWAEPDAGTEPAWQLAVPTEFAGLRHFLVLEELTAVDGTEWLRIQVPVRPNGSEGWIPREDVTLNDVTTRVLVDLSDRSVVVWDGLDIVIDTRVAIGTDRTPTPTGTYYIRDSFPWNPESVYGPWVFALSSYSEAIGQINGGDAVVAIHGTRDNSVLGSAVSLGCIRIDNDVLLEMSEIVEPGTPVEVVP